MKTLFTLLLLICASCATAQTVLQIDDGKGLKEKIRVALLSDTNCNYFLSGTNTKAILTFTPRTATNAANAGDLLYWTSGSQNYASRLAVPMSSAFYLGISGALPHYNSIDWIFQDPASTASNTILPTSTGIVNLTLKSAGGTDDFLDIIDASNVLQASFNSRGALLLGSDANYSGQLYISDPGTTHIVITAQDQGGVAEQYVIPHVTGGGVFGIVGSGGGLLTAGSGISITNTSGLTTIDATGGTGVTSFSAGTTGFTPNSATTGAVVLAGTLAIANGGTGQTSASTAFNALSPTTTDGDISFRNATTNQRLGIGSAYSVLQTDHVSLRPAWGAVNLSQSAAVTNLLGSVNGGTGVDGSAVTDGQLLIGQTSDNTFGLATITAGANISVTNAGHSITIANTMSAGMSNPMTTTGDIIYASNTATPATPARLGIGASTTVLHGGTTPSYSQIVNGDITNSTIDLTAKVTGTLPAANGGTANGFTAFTGPASSTKTFTLPNASATILTSNAAVTVGQGGTGQTSYTDGQLLIGNTTGNTLAKSTLTAGTGISITNGSGAITITNSGVGNPGASYQGASSNPTGTASLTEVMMGKAGSITPTASGTVYFIANGNARNGTNTDGGAISLRYGTGTAPTNGAATTGTAISSTVTYKNGTANETFPFSVQGVVTGLSVGTAYWIDLGNAAVTGGTSTISNASITAVEQPSSSSLATYQATPADPTGTTSITGVMMGLAGSITPSVTGQVLVTICGNTALSGATGAASVQIRYGTGSAPANAAVLTGTAIGGLIKSQFTASGQNFPFSATALITGLSNGTAYWLDLSLLAGTSTASIKNVSISAVER